MAILELCTQGMAHLLFTNHAVLKCLQWQEMWLPAELWITSTFPLMRQHGEIVNSFVKVIQLH